MTDGKGRKRKRERRRERGRRERERGERERGFSRPVLLALFHFSFLPKARNVLN